MFSFAIMRGRRLVSSANVNVIERLFEQFPEPFVRKLYILELFAHLLGVFTKDVRPVGVKLERLLTENTFEFIRLDLMEEVGCYPYPFPIKQPHRMSDIVGHVVSVKHCLCTPDCVSDKSDNR